MTLVSSPADATALSEALSTVHAVIYGYGVCIAHAAPTRREMILERLEEHRARRDAAARALRESGTEPPEAAAGYRLDSALASTDGITDPENLTPTDAVLLATALEMDACTAWRRGIERAASAETRAFCAEALQSAALGVTQWRIITTTRPSVDALPGAASEQR